MSDQEQPISTEAEPATAPETISLAEFFENVPPSRVKRIRDLVRKVPNPHGAPYFVFNTPELRLYCGNDNCNGTRIFRNDNENNIYIRQDNEYYQYEYIRYLCSNCQATLKTYSVAYRSVARDSGVGDCYKFGELPPYGPPISSRLISLIGPDRELFLKGRQCENIGLGIGAFVYYRRVVENQKTRILDRIIKVSERLRAPPETISTLQAAQRETQFAKALASAKNALPPSLLINGHNPLTLLHSALSVGVHDRTDEQCLELAQDIRVVLSELSERLAEALKDDAQLSAALHRLMGERNDKA